MEGPLKKKSFVPKMFKVFTMYIFATLAVFFGYIQLFGGVKNIAGTLPNGADGEVDTTFSDFLTNMMNMTNINLEDVALEFSSSDNQAKLALVADVAFDTITKQLYVDADLSFNDEVYDVSIVYTSPDAYLTIDESVYKFCTETENGTLDLSGLIGFITQNLNIDSTGFEEIQEAIGIDFENFKMGDLINQLDIATRKTDDGAIISINLMNIVQATINCDSSSNIQSMKIEDVKIKGNVLKFNAPKVEVNKENIAEKFETPDLTNVVDMSAVTDYLIYSQNLFENDFVEGDLKVVVGEKDYNAKIFIDNSEAFKAKIEAEVEGIAVSVIYANESVYLMLEDFGLSFKISDYKLWAEKIEAIVERETSHTVSEFVQTLIEDLLGDAESNLTSENGVWELISKIFSSSESINSTLPDSTTENENEFVMVWNNGPIISLKNQEKLLTEVELTYENYFANLTLEPGQQGFEVEGEYYDVSNLIPLVDVVDEITNAGQVGGKIELSYKENLVEIDYVVDFSNEVVAKLETEIFGEKVAIFVQNQNIYLQIGGVVVEGNISDLDQYIARLNEIFDTDIDLDNILPTSDASQIFEMVEKILNDLKLSSAEDRLAIIEYLTHKAEISVTGTTVKFSYNYKDLNVKMAAGASKQEIAIPTSTDNILDTLDKIESVKTFVESKQYATEISFSYKGENVSAKLSVDLINNVIAVENLTYKDLRLNLFIKENTVFVEFGDVKLKFKVETTEDIIPIVESILKENGVTSSENSDAILSDVLMEIFGEDVSKLSIAELFEKIALEIEGGFGDLTIGVDINSTNIVGFDASVKFDGKNLKSIELKLQDGIANIEIVDFSEILFDASAYYDFTSTQKGQILISVGGYDFVADVEINLNGKIYAKAETTILGLDVRVVLLDNMVYVTVGELKISGNLNEIKDIYEIISGIVGESVGQSLGNVNLQEILDKISMIDLKGLKVSANGEELEATYQNSDLMIQLVLNSNAEIGEVTTPVGCEDVKDVLPKIENLLNYIENGVFEFDFNLSYNGLDFAGTFKYADDVFEISNVLVAGEYANIRIESGVVYFSYGNMKFKFDIPENDGSDQSESLKNAIEKIASDTLGVEIKFGVFEEILTMLKSYTTDDLLNKIVVGLSGNSNDLNLTISNKKEFSLSKILSVNIKFENDNINSAVISIYDVLSVEIQNFMLDGESTIKPFDENDYKDYSTDFVSGMLDSLEVVPDVYAFSSDIAIRYSKTSFYGELVAMMIKDESAEFSIGGFVPAISIHTTSLGLNSYIYLIGQTVYIDINGLQVFADLNETTIDEVMTFVEDLLGTTLSDEAEVLDASTEAFRVILPAIDKIYGSWISQTEQGVQINIEDILQYGEQSYFDDIVLQAFISEYNNVIVPTKLIVGANIYDPNTTIYDDYSEYWLYDGVDENGNKIVLEDAITKDLNFGAYFTNISVGKFAESVDEVFAISDKDYQNIHSVMSNYGTTALSDFNSYETVLTLVDTIYNYGTSLQYQVGLSADISNSETGMIETSVGGDVIVEVRDPVSGESCDFDLFDGKIFNVQGDFDINASGTRHLVDLLYSNGAQGLYLSYSHGANIGQNAFRANIKNTNMSEIISMIVKFAGLDLSDSIKEAWNIGYCATDFSYVQSLLGMGDDDPSDDSSKADIALDSVESITKLLGLISLDKVTGEDGLSTTTLSLQIKLSDDVAPATVTLTLNEERNGDILETRLRQISIQDLNYGGKVIDVVIDIQDFDGANFDYDTTAQHHDLSSLPEFVDVAVNTINTKTFNFNGTISANIIGIVTMNIGLDLTASIDENNKLSAYAELTMSYGGIGGIAFDKSFDYRYITLELKNNVVTYHRYSQTEETEGGFLGWGGTKWNKVVEDMSGTYTLSELSANVSGFIKNVFGFSSLAMNTVDLVIDMIDVNPTIEEALLAFNSTDSGYTLTISGENLLGSSEAADIPLTVGKKVYSGYTFDEEGNRIDKDFGFIDSITGLQIVIGNYVKIYADLYSNNDAQSYTTASYQLRSSYDQTDGAYIMGTEMFTNDYYRKKYIATVGGLY